MTPDDLPPYSQILAVEKDIADAMAQTIRESVLRQFSRERAQLWNEAQRIWHRMPHPKPPPEIGVPLLLKQRILARLLDALEIASWGTHPDFQPTETRKPGP